MSKHKSVLWDQEDQLIAPNDAEAQCLFVVKDTIHYGWITDLNNTSQFTDVNDGTVYTNHQFICVTDFRVNEVDKEFLTNNFDLLLGNRIFELLEYLVDHDGRISVGPFEIDDDLQYGVGGVAVEFKPVSLNQNIQVEVIGDDEELPEMNELIENVGDKIINALRSKQFNAMIMETVESVKRLSMAISNDTEFHKATLVQFMKQMESMAKVLQVDMDPPQQCKEQLREKVSTRKQEQQSACPKQQRVLH